MDAIREDVNEQIKVVSTADGTPLYRAQGKIAALAGILELVGQARDLLDKPNFK